LPSLKQLQTEAEGKEREGLSNPASMAIFMRWRQFGGMEHGISLSDILTLPEWLLHDLGYIVGELEKERRRRPKKKHDKPKPRSRR